MGTAHSSIPPPLVEVSAPGGRVLVPPYTHFSVHPPKHGDPVYRPRSRPQRRPRPRPDIVIEEDDENWSEESMEGMGMSPRMGMGVGRRGMGMDGGGFGGMGGMGMGRGRGARPMYEMDGRPRSAPEMMGGYPGMGMGMPPHMGPGGMGPGGMGGMGGPGMAGPGMEGKGGMQEPPPGYSSMPSMPQYPGPRGGGMPGQNPYAYQPQHAPPSPPSSTGAPSEKLPRRPSRRPPSVNEHIPMGAYAKVDKSPRLSRSRTEPTTAERLSRGQSDSRRVGPSGKEWLKGDDFLDACTCTTGCTCREGHRVLYRARDDPVDSDSDYSARPRYKAGEIRYILKSKLGQDCGDHLKCKKSASSSETESESEIKRRKKKEEKKQRKQFEGLKEDMLDAIDEKLEAIKKARSSKAPSMSSPRPPFAGLNGAQNPFGMGAGIANGMDPLMAHKLGMGEMGMNLGGNPYAMGIPGMNRMPPGMAGLMAGKQMHPGPMPLGGMGGVNSEDNMSMADTEGMAMGNPYLAGGMKAKGLQPRFMSPGRRKPGVPGDMDMDHMALYGRAMGGRGGIRGGGPRTRRLDFGSDDFDRRRRPAIHKRDRSSRDRFGNGAGGDLGEDDDDDGPIAATHRVNLSGRGKSGRNSDRDRERQPRADTDDEY
ncbi:hypothetical protein EK21DRAFT_114671 [Setomelanomma holmii]|uniref:Uncharacterized protein n=1 Tax=Setomelanomma holmii TaxID=210430 RepID=A0A9P4H3H3_9PLEO|nr:hypothetical protein EK21DRAFT_114671 [Setomelanomma holmii]